MKKSFAFFVMLFCLFTFTSCNKTENVSDYDVVNKQIDNTNDYLINRSLTFDLFSNVLENKLNNSLVYNINKDENLIIYNEKCYLYKIYNEKYYLYNNVNLLEGNNYAIVDNINDALGLDIDTFVLTRGYYNPYDGGNGFFKVTDCNEKASYQIENDDKTKALEYICYNNTINVLQMGYNGKKSLDGYVNKFTNDIDIQNIFIPRGNYIVLDNFDLNVSNKGYYSYNATIYSDDSYKPTGYNNGCLFYVFNNVSNIIINGFNVDVVVNKKLDDPLLGLLSLRDALDVLVQYCSFNLPIEASIYSSSGIIDLFTGWKNIIVKNCRLENHSSTVAGGGIGVRDIYKKGCDNALFENNYIYSNCKDEVIAIFSGADTSLYPDDNGGGYIKNVCFRNNTIIGDKPNSDIGPRVVGLTVGYQISPVYNVSYLDNYIEMYSANYLFLYEYADDVVFKNNNVKIDSSYKEGLYVMFRHNPNALAASDISCNNNSFSFVDGTTLNTISQTGLEFKFINNEVNVSKISRVFDSVSDYEGNKINADSIKCVYHNVKNTKNNTINCNYLTVVYEFYNVDVLYDVEVSDVIFAGTISSNFMMFNGGNVRFNNHSITFNNFDLEVDKIDGKYYYLAYDTSSIKDSVVIYFKNSHLAYYEYDGHNFIARDDENKVIIKYE